MSKLVTVKIPDGAEVWLTELLRNAGYTTIVVMPMMDETVNIPSCWTDPMYETWEAPVITTTKTFGDEVIWYITPESEEYMRMNNGML